MSKNDNISTNTCHINLHKDKGAVFGFPYPIEKLVLRIPDRVLVMTASSTCNFLSSKEDISDDCSVRALEHNREND